MSLNYGNIPRYMHVNTEDNIELNQNNYGFDSFTPMISLENLLTVCDIILIMLLWRIWNWIDI